MRYSCHTCTGLLPAPLCQMPAPAVRPTATAPAAALAVNTRGNGDIENEADMDVQEQVGSKLLLPTAHRGLS
jgi:hypothetical protein